MKNNKKWLCLRLINFNKNIQSKSYETLCNKCDTIEYDSEHTHLIFNSVDFDECAELIALANSFWDNVQVVLYD